MSPAHCHLGPLWESVSAAPPCGCRGKDSKPCIVDAVRKHCDILHPAIWQRLHVLSVTETNGLGSKTSTLYFKLRELCKPLLVHRNVYLQGPGKRGLPAAVNQFFVQCSSGHHGGQEERE